MAIPSSSGPYPWNRSIGGEISPTTRRVPSFSLDVRVLPAIGTVGAASSDGEQAVRRISKCAPELDVGEIDAEYAGIGKLSAVQRIHQLEQSIAFLNKQHMELVSSLHDEVDRLKRKNRGVFSIMLILIFAYIC